MGIVGGVAIVAAAIFFSGQHEVSGIALQRFGFELSADSLVDVGASDTARLRQRTAELLVTLS